MPISLIKPLTSISLILQACCCSLMYHWCIMGTSSTRCARGATLLVHTSCLVVLRPSYCCCLPARNLLETSKRTGKWFCNCIIYIFNFSWKFNLFNIYRYSKIGTNKETPCIYLCGNGSTFILINSKMFYHVGFFVLTFYLPFFERL